MKNICVIGSLNIDMTINIPRFHAPGETILGRGFSTFTGGKGGNQAIAAARLGAPVSLIGCLGEDDFGHKYIDVLKKEKVDTGCVLQTGSAPTGTAFIEVADNADNRIAYVPGANGCLDRAAIEGCRGLLEKTDILMFQLETPVEGAFHAAGIVHEAGGCVILDPAPVQELTNQYLSLCDYVTPNETELALLTGIAVQDLKEAERAAMQLLDRGAKAVVHKRGKQGALLVDRNGARLYTGFQVNAVDTTAAGDSFNAGLAAGLAMGWPIEKAIRLANAVGALSTTKMGAQGAMPSFEEALALMGGED